MAEIPRETLTKTFAQTVQNLGPLIVNTSSNAHKQTVGPDYKHLHIDSIQEGLYKTLDSEGQAHILAIYRTCSISARNPWNYRAKQTMAIIETDDKFMSLRESLYDIKLELERENQRNWDSLFEPIRDKVSK